ncbi:MAG: hypothetical protein M3297_09095 [Thermoproteota archaeon]|jgi:hypothetical protein|nr:hypothetical protein [Thermoproteota archaeon]
MVKQNSYPLKDWHFEHMQKTVLKYVSGISENAFPYQKRQHKKYSGNLSFVNRSIQFDIKHGVTREEVDTFLDKVRNDSSFAEVRQRLGSGERLEQLQI